MLQYLLQYKNLEGVRLVGATQQALIVPVPEKVPVQVTPPKVLEIAVIVYEPTVGAANV